MIYYIGTCFSQLAITMSDPDPYIICKGQIRPNYKKKKKRPLTTNYMKIYNI